MSDESVHFTVDARIVKQLGEQLVPSDLMALGELVKNAYDADATTVTIDYYHAEDGHRLVIEDDGNGMTLEEIRQGWMHIGTANKEVNPRSPRFNRVRSGVKGVGRFAAQRLGVELEVHTTSLGSGQTFIFRICWREFESGKALESIQHLVESAPASPESHGTNLIIHHPRVWTTEELKAVLADLCRLYTPPSDAGGFSEGVKVSTDQGFEVVAAFHGEGHTEVVEDKDLLRDERVMHLFGEIDEHGVGRYRMDFCKPKAESRWSRFGTAGKSPVGTQNAWDDAAPLRTGPLTFDLDLFVFEKGVTGNLSPRKAAVIGRQHGGVRIRRDGFIVQPYGLEDDDWLGQDEHVGARRIPLTMWRNQQVMGEVWISRLGNPHIEDLLTRRGLQENEALEDLKAFVFEGLKQAAYEHANLTGKKAKNPPGQRRVRPSEVLKATIEKQNSQRGDSSAGGTTPPQGDTPPSTAGDPAPSSQPPVIPPEVAQALVAAVEEAEQADLNEREMLRVLASMGTGLAVFAHEFRGIDGDLANALDEMAVLVPRLPVDLRPAIASITERLRDSQRVLRTYSRYINDFVADRSRSRRQSMELWDVCTKFIQQVEPLLAGKAVSHTVKVDRGMFTRPMHRAELLSVLFNLVTNAVKALLAPSVTERRLLIRGFEQDDETLCLRVSDTGCGVPEDINDELFEPFKTRSHDPRDETLGQGTGLGLYILKDILDDYDGTVALVEPDEGFRTTFEVTLPAREDA